MKPKIQEDHNGELLLNAAGVARFLYEVEPGDSTSASVNRDIEIYRRWVDSHLAMEATKAAPRGLEEVLWDLVGRDLEAQFRGAEGASWNSWEKAIFGKARAWARSS